MQCRSGQTWNAEWNFLVQRTMYLGHAWVMDFRWGDGDSSRASTWWVGGRLAFFHLRCMLWLLAVAHFLHLETFTQGEGADYRDTRPHPKTPLKPQESTLGCTLLYETASNDENNIWQTSFTTVFSSLMLFIVVFMLHDFGFNIWYQKQTFIFWGGFLWSYDIMSEVIWWLVLLLELFSRILALLHFCNLCQ